VQPDLKAQPYFMTAGASLLRVALQEAKAMQHQNYSVRISRVLSCIHFIALSGGRNKEYARQTGGQRIFGFCAFVWRPARMVVLLGVWNSKRSPHHKNLITIPRAYSN
jgi:hypothetical protein